VLDQLLEKYAEYGIGQLEDLHVLQVPPLTAIGSRSRSPSVSAGPKPSAGRSQTSRSSSTRRKPCSDTEVSRAPPHKPYCAV